MGAARSSLFFEKVEKGRMGERSKPRPALPVPVIGGGRTVSSPGTIRPTSQDSMSCFSHEVYLLCGMQYIFFVGCCISSLRNQVIQVSGFITCGQQAFKALGEQASQTGTAGTKQMLACSQAFQATLWVGWPSPMASPLRQAWFVVKRLGQSVLLSSELKRIKTDLPMKFR